MKGFYYTGSGLAHRNGSNHKDVFGCAMCGTFNIEMGEEFRGIHLFPPTVDLKGRTYWLLKIRKDKETRYGWAVRWTGSKLRPSALEVLTKKPLPDSFKSDNLEVEAMEKWSPEQIREWSGKVDWFQSFPWASKQRSDSKLMWDAVNHLDWKGAEVLDIGCNYGYHAFQASKLGAAVTGMDRNSGALGQAVIINEHIEMQDVLFTTNDDGRVYDVIFYFSVHHQIDASYDTLKAKIEELQKRSRKKLFVELILPPMFGKGYAESQVDEMVGGKVLLTYPHKVRGVRRIYECEGLA